jgi:hypothetical protein
MINILLLVGVAVVVVVGTYLFLRNNPKKKAAIDKAVDKIKQDWEK